MKNIEDYNKKINELKRDYKILNEKMNNNSNKN